ncbi:MAG: leucine-rich repeat protein [Ruminococcus sp.]|nr:leucine-rich repeat protein [Ruminococcus sp.]
MKIFKKTAAAVIALTLCNTSNVGILPKNTVETYPINAIAADIVKSGVTGVDKNLKWTLDSDGVLTISGEGEMLDQLYTNTSVWYDNKNIKSIVIENGVTKIGAYAFNKCTSLTSVILPDTLKYISDKAFDNCTSLKSVSLGCNDVLIGSKAFRGCGNSFDITRRRKKLEYTVSDNKENKINIADSHSIKIDSLPIIDTHDELSGYYLFGFLDILQEVCSKSGDKYAAYGGTNGLILIPENEKSEILQIINMGYTFGAAAIGDDDCIYIMWGKQISDEVIDESLQEKNIVISKYDMNGTLIGECGFTVDYTDAQFIFDSGNVNIDYNNGVVGVLYNTEWTFKYSGDGNHHQGSGFISIDAETMKEIYFKKNNVSHSFGVSMIPDGYGFAAIERGDCYERGINLTKFYDSASSETLCFSSSGQYGEAGSHKNATHLHMGGIAASKSTYAVTGKSERHYTSGNYADSGLATGNYDVFVRIVDKSLIDSASADCEGVERIDEATGEVADRNIIWLTECNKSETAGNVKAVTLNDGSYCILWEKLVDGKFDSIQYVILDECGNILRNQTAIQDARLSNTSIQPIVQDNVLTWAVGDEATSSIIWYNVDINKLQSETSVTTTTTKPTTTTTTKPKTTTTKPATTTTTKPKTTTTKPATTTTTKPKTTTTKPATTTTTKPKTTTTKPATTTTTKPKTTTTKPATTTTKPKTTTTKPATTKPITTTIPISKINYGDANCDGSLTIADATAIFQAISNKDKYALSEQGAINADVCNRGDGILISDAITIQKVDAKLYSAADLPVIE